MIETKIINCKIHGESLSRKHSRGQGKSRFRCARCAASAVQNIVDAKRKRAYAEFGSCCTKCGYNKCSEALEWHHIDPLTKDMNPSKVFNRSYENIVKELKKCILLCANCHREEHVRIRLEGNVAQ